ncbi:MAG: UDP-N-acetylglucosamine 1-carboxyvinyltransferase [Firmicutes bacterium]|nr:UDP-N-acetylglucosamine 1-carboxyvinyltransferase [Bacillota bacterium]
MQRFVVKGGKPLMGEYRVKAAKNSVLPIMAAAVLSNQEIIIENVPNLVDIQNMSDIIKSIGGTAEYTGASLRLNCTNASPRLIESNLTGVLRSSIFLLGPILSRFKSVKIGLPGGCAIGARPIDLHIAGLKQMGVFVTQEDGFIACDGKNMKGGTVNLTFPSVGATENLMMAAVFAKGTTVIHGAAQEPEIVDLQNFINFLGGRISGAGSSVVTVEGTDKLSGGGAYRPFGDRIAASTFLAAAAATGGRVTVNGIYAHHVSSVTDALIQSGCRVDTSANTISLIAPETLKPLRIKTNPHPHFPTDMQPQLTAMLCLAQGESTVIENVFENRFMYTAQLNKMGARIALSGNTAHITGVKMLYAAQVAAEDLRGGAALVIAALAAQGKSVIENVLHIDRGYESMEDALQALGADIVRSTVP